jgi:hypothetical protein
MALRIDGDVQFKPSTRRISVIFAEVVRCSMAMSSRTPIGFPAVVVFSVFRIYQLQTYSEFAELAGLCFL